MNQQQLSAARIIASDTECVKILTDNRMLGTLTPKLGMNTAYAAFLHDGCYCLASRHTGHAVATENGYVIVMLPCNVVSLRDAAAFFSDCIHEQNPNGDRIEVFADLDAAPATN